MFAAWAFPSPKMQVHTPALPSGAAPQQTTARSPSMYDARNAVNRAERIRPLLRARPCPARPRSRVNLARGVGVQEQRRAAWRCGGGHRLNLSARCRDCRWRRKCRAVVPAAAFPYGSPIRRDVKEQSARVKLSEGDAGRRRGGSEILPRAERRARSRIGDSLSAQRSCGWISTDAQQGAGTGAAQGRRVIRHPVLGRCRCAPTSAGRRRPTDWRARLPRTG